MAMQADGGATLEYVVREVRGDIPHQIMKYDQKEMKKIVTDTVVKNPVIVFFPNGASQIMTAAHAEAKGFLRQPPIMNFESVQDQQSPVGQFKYAMTPKIRAQAWMAMEAAVIAACVRKSGHPLPLDATYSEQSVYIDNDVLADAAA